MKTITPLTEAQLEAIRSPRDVITILRSVVEVGDQLFHPELNRIIARCVVVLQSAEQSVQPVRIADPGPSKYDREPEDSPE